MIDYKTMFEYREALISFGDTAVQNKDKIFELYCFAFHAANNLHEFKTTIRNFTSGNFVSDLIL